MTFLNIPQLERQGADTIARVEELEMVNQSLRNRDKLKDNSSAITRPTYGIINKKEDSKVCER
jgi:uncharacterized protein YfkK (UPF0435 family)